MALETARKYAREYALRPGVLPGHFEGEKAGGFEHADPSLHERFRPRPPLFVRTAGSTPAFPAHALTTMR
jgi:hypothetical protein